VAVKHFAEAGCTNSIKVMFTKEGRTSSMKTLLDGKLTLGYN
jgi:hypothetical protein